MKLAILHLSDVHIASAADPVLRRGHSIVAALRAQISGETAVLIVISGDVANSGASSEYELAKQFIGELLDAVGKIPQIALLGSVVVPGNHDCNFRDEGDARPGLMGIVAAGLETYDLAGDSMRQLLGVQTQFFDFEAALSGCEKPTRERISSRCYFSCNGRVVSVLSLNSALFSRLGEKSGQLYFPLHALTQEDRATDFSLTVFHHPYPWLEAMNGRELRRRVESESDLVLTGHEHDGDSYVRIDRQGEETGYIEGLALQTKGPTGFNIVLVDFETETNQIYRYSWAGDLYQPDPARGVRLRQKTIANPRTFRKQPRICARAQRLGNRVQPLGEKESHVA